MRVPAFLRKSLGHFLIALLIAAGAVAPASPVGAQDAGGDNAAVAVNTKDGSSVFKFAFSVRRVTGDAVTNTNAAVAYASCTDCQTVAVAIQIILVSGDPSLVTPENYAIAINENCESCLTMAAAYQFVFGTGEAIRLTDDGHRRLAALRHRLAELRHSDLTLEQLDAELAALVAEIWDVVTTEVVPVDRAGDDDEDEDADDRPDAETTTTTPATSVTTESTTSTTSEPTTTTAPEETTTTSTTGETTTTTAPDETTTTSTTTEPTTTTAAP